MSPKEHSGHFFTDPSNISGETVILGGRDARHLQVRRARPGDAICVGDGAGRVWDAVIEDVEGAEVVARVRSCRTHAAPMPRLVVLQGLAKSGKVDWVVEKLVELGVDEIGVFASGRSVPTWNEGKRRTMRDRWERVAYAAAKQSERAWLPVVAGPLDRAALLARVGGLPAVLVADPQAPVPLRRVLEGREAAEEIGVVVGPEGGLSPAEVQELVAAGAQAVGLGRQILRTETAALALCTAIMYSTGRFG